MNDPPRRELQPGTRRTYGRPDPDMTDEEIEAWAKAFVDAILSNPTSTDQ